MAGRKPPDHAPISLGSPSFTTVDVAGFSASEVWFPPSASLPSHTHDRAVLAVTLSGSIDATLGGRRLESWRESYWTEPRGEAHANRVGTDGARVVVIQPSQRRFDALGTVGQWMDEVHHRRDPRILHLALQIREELHRGGPAMQIMIESLALEMIAFGFRGRVTRERSLPAFAVQAFDLVNSCFRNPLKLSEIAEVVGVHPAHLTRTFRAHYGKSVGEATRDARLTWALNQIRHTQIPLSRVALESGFADQSHMNRWINRYFGTTPGELRRGVTMAGGAKSGLGVKPS